MNRVAGIRDVCLLHAGLLNSAHLSCPNPHKLITFDSGLCGSWHGQRKPAGSDPNMKWIISGMHQGSDIKIQFQQKCRSVVVNQALNCPGWTLDFTVLTYFSETNIEKLRYLQVLRAPALDADSGGSSGVVAITRLCKELPRFWSTFREITRVPCLHQTPSARVWLAFIQGLSGTGKNLFDSPNQST